MKAIWTLLVVAIITMGMTGVATAGASANHQVTVTVNFINELAITGGNIELIISTATAGSEPNADTVATCTMAWTTTDTTKKITAATNLESPTYTLQVTAISVTGGSATAPVTLSTTPTNFVTGVAETTGGCTLSYVASTTASLGKGQDVHTVTYTIVAV